MTTVSSVTFIFQVCSDNCFLKYLFIPQENRSCSRWDAFSALPWCVHPPVHTWDYFEELHKDLWPFQQLEELSQGLLAPTYLWNICPEACIEIWLKKGVEKVPKRFSKDMEKKYFKKIP